MQPPVKQHLESLRKTLVEVVLPELPAKSFVAEQAGLIAASLALLAEVQPYEDDYLRLELRDVQAMLGVLGSASPGLADDADRDALALAVHAAKQALSTALEVRASANGGRLPAEIRDAIAPLLDRQLAREAAWSRLTGFNPGGAQLAPIREVLAQQRGGA